MNVLKAWIDKHFEDFELDEPLEEIIRHFLENKTTHHYYQEKSFSLFSPLLPVSRFHPKAEAIKLNLIPNLTSFRSSSQPAQKTAWQKGFSFASALNPLFRNSPFSFFLPLLFWNRKRSAGNQQSLFCHNKLQCRYFQNLWKSLPLVMLIHWRLPGKSLMLITRSTG